MSLINQMLQELDKRGASLGTAGERKNDASATISDIAGLTKPTQPLVAQSSLLPRYAIRMMLFLLVGAAIGFAWTHFSVNSSGTTQLVASVPALTSPQAKPSATATVASATIGGRNSEPSNDANLSASSSTISAAKASLPSIASSQAAVVVSSEASNEGTGADAHSLSLKFAEVLSSLPTSDKPASQVDAQHNVIRAAAAKPVAPNPISPAVESVGGISVQAKLDEKGKAEVRVEAAGSKVARFAETSASPQLRIEKPSSPQQRAENEYMRANQLMQQGKNPEALQALEQALSFDGHHVAARHAMANLLLAFNRQDEAMRRLQMGIQLDPGYTVFAVLLARIQAERKQLPAAIETMLASLPYASGNADYQALLAALLQRDKRHKEAIEHYQIAVQLQSENGVWWMGLGISLQAENLNAQALEAFQRAKQSRSLNPTLLGFVEQKISQLQNH